MDVDIKSVSNVDPIPLQPVTIADVQKIAPAAIHVKELNQIAPLLIESLRVDHVRNVSPLRVERFNVTHLPTVNLTLSRLPSVDVSVRRFPALGLALQQQFAIPSRYLVRARLLGLEIMRFEIDGCSRLEPRATARREEFRTHERSFPEVAAAGNPAIPSRVTEKRATRVIRAPPAWRPRRPPLNVGAPRFNYTVAAATPDSSGARSTVSSGD